MTLKALDMWRLFLLVVVWNMYCKDVNAQTTNILAPCQYEIDVVVAIDLSKDIPLDKFNEQKKLLIDSFANWEQFGSLQLVTYAGETYNVRNGFENGNELNDYINGLGQADSGSSLCDVFRQPPIRESYPYVIIFGSEFSASDYCSMEIDYFEDKVRIISLIAMTDRIDQASLKGQVGSHLQLIEWHDENSKEPNDWASFLYKAIGCVAYPCNNHIMIAYDTSKELSMTGFDRETKFLTNHLFNNWTSFERLLLFGYDSHSSEPYDLYSLDDLIGYIRRNGHSKKFPDLCGLDLSYIHDRTNVVIFLSTFDKAKIDCPDNIETLNKADSTTFVLLKPDIVVSSLKSVFPKASTISWSVTEVPHHWEEQFMLAYGCSSESPKTTSELPITTTELPTTTSEVTTGSSTAEITTTTNSVQTTPTNSPTIMRSPCEYDKVLVAVDLSARIPPEKFQNQLSLINNAFDNWENFMNLSLAFYAGGDEKIKLVSPVENLSTLHWNISSAERSQTSTTLCDFLNKYSVEETPNYLIIFGSELHLNDHHCEKIDEGKISFDFISVVALSNEVDSNLLPNVFPTNFQLLEWHDEYSKEPENWASFFYKAIGCVAYPCENEIVFAVDNSNELTVTELETEGHMLSNYVLKDWTSCRHLTLFYYDFSFGKRANLTYNVQDVINFKEPWWHRDEDPPNLCHLIHAIWSSEHSSIDTQNVVIFLSTFNKTLMAGPDCKEDIDQFNKANLTTFVLLKPTVNDSDVKSVFHNAQTIDWHVETPLNHTPKDWQEKFMLAYGCPLPDPTTKGTTIENTEPTTEITSTVPPPTTKPSKTYVVYLAIFIPLAIISILIIGICCCCCWRRQKNRQREAIVDIMAIKHTAPTELVDQGPIAVDPWEIRHRNLAIKFEHQLGSGAFGEVYLGKLIGQAGICRVYPDSLVLTQFRECDVAVKVLPRLCADDETARRELEQEIQFMKGLRFHVNIVCMLGYVSDFTDHMLVLEYCSKGDLLKFMRANKEKFLTTVGEERMDKRLLISFSSQIAKGMEHLASLGLIHRDLAARNILLTETLICKISDFGMCRAGQDNLYTSKKGKLPVRWMAIEALKKFEFSEKSDVWSYSVVLYEIFSFGELPYAGVENVLAHLESGQRLEKPEHCPEEIYQIMSNCWREDRNDRPNFKEISRELFRMLETSTQNYYLEAEGAQREAGSESGGCEDDQDESVV